MLSFGTKNPRRNLPAHVRNKRGEILFQSSFLKVWETTLVEAGIGGNQFELPGFGIADYLWVNNKGSMDAFEFKMGDWKRGFTQACRYRNYANRSILVLPQSIAKRALVFLADFQATGVGLVSFDPTTQSIEKHYWPEASEPLNRKAHASAFSILKGKRKFRQLTKAA
ncbi:MAG TPA: hypothetical protein VLM37_10640 [Fibrobacteraceae bacterium]|nr:hypothetical protein [Fibrobacteraceae bacterium]